MKKLLTAPFIVMLMACICIGGALFVQATTTEPNLGSEAGGGAGSETEPVVHTHVWTYENNVATCSAAGCTVADATCSNHTAGTEWSQKTDSDTYHYHTCTTCGIEMDKTNCSGGTATCVALATCSGCLNTYGTYANHDTTGGLLQNTELYYHYYFCSVCEQEVEVDDCSGGRATCEERAICQDCSNVYGELMHNKDTELKQNAEEGYHYYSCVDCGEELDVEDCYGGTAADCCHLPECVVCGQTYGEVYGEHTSAPIAVPHEDDPEAYHTLIYPCCDRTEDKAHEEGTAANCHSAAVCAACGVQYGEIDPDNHDVSNATYAPLNATHHKVICGCGVELESAAAHNGGTATCSKQAVCADCGTVYGAYNDVHSYDNDCDADCNDCGATRTPAEHVFGEWTVTKQPTETEEGEQKRVCTVCGETQTATVAAITNPGGSGEPEPDGIKTSTVVIIVAAVVVAAVAIGAVVILVKKKRK